MPMLFERYDSVHSSHFKWAPNREKIKRKKKTSRSSTHQETTNNTQSCTLLLLLGVVRTVSVRNRFVSVFLLILPFAHSQRLSFIPVCVDVDIIVVVVVIVCVACVVCGFYFLFFFLCYSFCVLYRFSSYWAWARRLENVHHSDASIQYKFIAICRLRFIYKSEIHHTRHTTLHRSETKLKKKKTYRRKNKARISFFFSSSFYFCRFHSFDSYGKFLLNLFYYLFFHQWKVKFFNKKKSFGNK